MRGGTPRTLSRLSIGRRAVISLASSVSIVLGLLAAGFAPAAMAGSGDFCGPGHYLTSGQECVHQYDTYKQLESWSTYGENQKSCVGITKELAGGVWITWSCLSTGNVPYEETYCNEACNGYLGYGMVYNNSSSPGYFTGWGYWN